MKKNTNSSNTILQSRKYLDQTLSSFINDEVMDEIEILIVDDGSKDRRGTNE
ncbi:MAG: hypothetical protein R3Y35_11080 [Clostridia bacterium]